MDLSVLNNFKILLFENALSVYLNLEDNCIYAAWSGYQDVNTLKAGCEQLLAIMQKQNYPKLLNDNSKVITGDNWDQDPWICDDFAAKLSQTELKYLAWVFAPNQENRESAEKIIQKIASPAIAIGFDNVATAQAWIHSV